MTLHQPVLLDLLDVMQSAEGVVLGLVHGLHAAGDDEIGTARAHLQRRSAYACF